jgi:hypothetical protein
MFKGAFKGAIGGIRKLEGYGAKATAKASTMNVPTASKATRMAAPFVGTSGRLMSSAGRNPYATMAVGGMAGVGLASQMRSRTALSGGNVANMTRQDTMYNRKMRSAQGQSSGAGGLTPRSMGGYA